MNNIAIDVAGTSFVLTGDIHIIYNNGRAKSNFTAIGASFDDVPEKITIGFENQGVDECYRDLKRLFGRFNLISNQTDEAEKVLEDINNEHSKFINFSTKARCIRNNEHEGNDFNNFTGVIESELQRVLYARQLLSAYHLAFAQNACNFSVPGAGKTSIVYAAYAYLKSLPHNDDKHVDRMLIICPLAAFAPWEDEYRECFGRSPAIKKLVSVSARDRADHFITSGNTEITLISYQSASSDIEIIRNYLRNHNTMVVLDEAHKIKNTDDEAVWAQTILSIADDAKARVVLTGTPAPNSYADLYNLYKFIWPHKNIIEFPLHYLDGLYKSADINRLIEQISPFFIRIKKSDLGLPDANHYPPIYVPMDDVQREIYNHIESRSIATLQSESQSNSFTGELKKARIIRLRQCLTNPALLKKPLQDYQGLGKDPYSDDRNISQAIENYGCTPNKFLAAKNLVEEISNNNGADGKVIIWAYFIDNIESLAEYLRSMDIQCETIYGATPNENDDTEDNVRTRQQIIRDFHDDDCYYKVIIANPFAVGESISLHKSCRNAIYLEKDFNAATYMQSKDRIHRYGLQENDQVNYYYLISEDSIDDVIHERVIEKERRMLEAIEREEIPLLIGNMEDGDDADENDIRAIIRDYHDRKNS